MRARLAIAKSGLSVELREVVLKDKPQALLEVSQKATVPVLALANGQIIEESLEIMIWALEQNDPDGWLRNMGENLIKENDTTFKKNLDRYKYFNRYPERSMEQHRAAGETFLKTLEGKLEHNALLTGDHLRIVDIAILPFIRQFAQVDADWFAMSPYHNTRRWLKMFLESPLLGQVMDTYPQWHQGDTQTVFQNTPE